MHKKRDLASAKIEMLLAAALDDGLSKLALRAAGLLAGRYMNSDRDGKAFAAVPSYCRDLGIASDAKVRVALGSLVERGYLQREQRTGETTRYSIHARFFAAGQEAQEDGEDDPTPPHGGAGSDTPTPSQDGKGSSADTPSQNGKGGFPLREGGYSQDGKGASRSGKGTPSRGGNTNTGE
ncbi:hypothetical protein AMST5_00063 [freshwater sediment metagenome]|uniref:Helix-turn-helix domain-containing protein n=1 Tax=freshwater sediment metagenome TaxID=556182 RepID=A0AA48RBH6_9ZZZZ